MIAKDGIANRSIRSRIWQLATLACGALVVLGLLLAWSLERDREANAWVEHTQTVLRALAAYTRQIVDAETGQRGYLLTGQEEYLIPYNEALINNKIRFEALNTLITDEGEQQKVQRLGKILTGKLQDLAETIQLFQDDDRTEALAIVIEGRRRRYTVEFKGDYTFYNYVRFDRVSHLLDGDRRWANASAMPLLTERCVTR
jgi:CHASE3 domain sensor protein